MAAAPVLVVGGSGQLGTALRRAFPAAHAAAAIELDLADPDAVARFAFTSYDVVLNAAAYTAVDAAETDGAHGVGGQRQSGHPALLAAQTQHGFTLVHVSSDYVFDGTVEEHPEDEPLSPLGVYGQSKAAGDLAVATTPRHYLLRTSWVVGDGHNFVRTMQRLAATASRRPSSPTRSAG